MDNYELSRNRAQDYFLGFSQEEIIRRWGLDWDEDYLYVIFFGRQYRICRKTGKIIAPTGEQADYCQSLTIFDLLCHSDGRIAVSEKFATVNSLKGAPKSGGVTLTGHTRLAYRIDSAPEEFHRACRQMGAIAVELGDICYRFCMFDKLYVLAKFYHGDEEFPPSVTFLWQENTLEHMYYETVFYAAGCLAQQLEEAF